MSLAYLLQFYGSTSSTRGTPLVCCVSVGVCLQQSPRRVPAIPNFIPFKGQVLNMISQCLMNQTADILPNALVQNVDPNVVVQKRMLNLNVEWSVCGHLWGSLAASYERGDRTFCGSPNGLHRFQKLDVPHANDKS